METEGREERRKTTRAAKGYEEVAIYETASLKHSECSGTRLSSRPSSEWNEDDFDVLANGAVVGRILKVHAAPVGSPWIWTLAFGHHEDRTPTHGYAATREAAMAAFAKSWRRE